MNTDLLFNNFHSLAEAPNGIQKLRELILQLAVQGKLVPQDPNDEPASVLLEKIKTEKERLIKEGKIKEEKPLTPINKDEASFDLPSGWEWAQLKDTFYPISVGQLKVRTVDILPTGSFPVVDQGQSYIAGYTNEENKVSKIPGPVIVFGDHTRAVKFVDFNFVAGADGVKILRPVLVDEYYFYWVIRSLKLKDRGYGRHYNLLLDNIIAIPPLEEQKRIVATVDKLMALCDELEIQQQKQRERRVHFNNASLDKLLTASDPEEFTSHGQRICDNFNLLYDNVENVTKLRQAVLQLAVQGKLVPQDPNDEPASGLLKNIKAEKERLVKEGRIKKEKTPPPINEEDMPFNLPSGWEWVRFMNVATIASKLVKPTSYLDYPHIAPDNIEKFTGRLLPYRTVKEDDVRSANHRFYYGQILYSKIRPNLAKVVTVDFDGLCSADMYPIYAHILTGYLLKYMLSSTFLSMSVKRETRVAMPKINQLELKRILVPLPPYEEQYRIVAKVGQLMALCDELEAKITKSQHISEKLMEAVVREVIGV